MLEYKIDWGAGYRVYFGRDGDLLVILLTGGTKQRQVLPCRARDSFTQLRREEGRCAADN